VTAARRRFVGFLTAARSEVALAREQLHRAVSIRSIGVSCPMRTPPMIVCGWGAPRVWRHTLGAHCRPEEGTACCRRLIHSRTRGDIGGGGVCHAHQPSCRLRSACAFRRPCTLSARGHTLGRADGHPVACTRIATRQLRSRAPLVGEHNRCPFGRVKPAASGVKRCWVAAALPVAALGTLANRGLPVGGRLAGPPRPTIARYLETKSNSQRQRIPFLLASSGAGTSPSYLPYILH